MFKIDGKRAQDTYGVIKAKANDQIVTVVNELASVLMPEQGTSDLVDDLISKCKTVADRYNTNFLPGVQSLLKVYESVVELDENLKKATVSDIANVTGEFTTRQLDPAKVF